MKLFSRHNRVPDMLIVDEADLLDEHPFAREEVQEEVEQEVITLSSQQILERRQQEQAQHIWW